MKSNIIALNGIRPERWAIGVGLPGDNVISCFYSESSQCWAGLVYVDSMDKLPTVLDEAKRVMRTARLQNTQVEVVV